MTTASAPSSSTPVSSSISITPDGVARAQAGTPERQQPGVDRGQPVDVLVGADDRGQRRPVELLGNGQLQQHAADGAIAVEAFELFGYLLEGRVGGQAPVEGHHADLDARALLAGDIHSRGGVIADEHGRETRRAADFAREHLDVASDVGAHSSGDRPAVDDRCAHEQMLCVCSEKGTRASAPADGRVLGHELALGAVVGETHDDHAPGLDAR